MVDGCGGSCGGHAILGEILSVLAHGGGGGRAQVFFVIRPWRNTRICESSEPGGHLGWPPPKGNDTTTRERVTRMKGYTRYSTWVTISE